ADGFLARRHVRMIPPLTAQPSHGRWQSRCSLHLSGEVFMAKTIAIAAVLMMSAGSTFANEASRLAGAASAVREIRNEIPQEYWARARCVLAIPELKKAAFIVGGEYGKGVMSCRAGEQWSAP